MSAGWRSHESGASIDTHHRWRGKFWQLHDLLHENQKRLRD